MSSDIRRNQMQIMIVLFGVLLLGAVYGLGILSLKQIVLASFLIIGIGIFSIPYKYALILIFVYVGFHGFLKVVTNRHPVIHVGVDILTVALCGRFLLEFIFKRGEIPKNFPPMAKLIFALFAWFLVTIANPFQLSLFASLAGAKIYVTMPILFFFGFYLTKTVKDAEMFLMPWLLVAIIHTIFSLYQNTVGMSAVLALSQNYAYEYKKYEGLAFRPVGLTHSPGGPSSYLSLPASFLMYLIFYFRSSFTKLVGAICLPAFTLTLLTCQVRANLIKGMISIFVFFAIHIVNLKNLSAGLKKRLVGIGSLVALLAAIAIPYGVNNLLSVRDDSEKMLEKSLKTFDIGSLKKSRSGAMGKFLIYLHEIPFGAGLSRTGAAGGKFQMQAKQNPFLHELSFFTDNMFLAVMVDLGIPGLLIILGFAIVLIIGSFLHTRSVTYERSLGLQAVILGTLISIMFGAYGGEALLYNPEASFFWFFSGVLVKLRYVNEPVRMPARIKKTSLEAELADAAEVPSSTNSMSERSDFHTSESRMKRRRKG